MKNLSQDLVQLIFLLLPLYLELYKVLLLEFYKAVEGKFTEASWGSRKCQNQVDRSLGEGLSLKFRSRRNLVLGSLGEE